MGESIGSGIISIGNREMEDYRKVGATRVSRIVLIKDTQSLIFNDELLIHYANRSVFLIVWTLCKSFCTNEDMQKHGGLDAGELFDLSSGEGSKLTSEASLTTLWHDVIEFRRPRVPWMKYYEMTNLRHKEVLTTETINNENVGKMLRSVFHKISPPKNSKYHKNKKLFSIKALPEQISVYQSECDIDFTGGAKLYTRDTTKYRKSREDIGIICWHDTIKVDNDGSAESIIQAELVNLVTKPLTFLNLPIWADNPAEIKKRRLKAWLPNKEDVPIEITTDKNKSSSCEFCLRFPKPVQLGNTFQFSISYYTPKAFIEENEYFEWYFDYIQFQYRVDINFPKVWTIKSPVVFDGDEEDPFPVKIDKSHILSWNRYFPIPGHKYTIKFFISKRK